MKENHFPPVTGSDWTLFYNNLNQFKFKFNVSYGPMQIGPMQSSLRAKMSKKGSWQNIVLTGSVSKLSLLSKSKQDII